MTSADEAERLCTSIAEDIETMYGIEIEIPELVGTPLFKSPRPLMMYLSKGDGLPWTVPPKNKPQIVYYLNTGDCPKEDYLQGSTWKYVVSFAHELGIAATEQLSKYPLQGRISAICATEEQMDKHEAIEGIASRVDRDFFDYIKEKKECSFYGFSRFQELVTAPMIIELSTIFDGVHRRGLKMVNEFLEKNNIPFKEIFEDPYAVIPARK